MFRKIIIVMLTFSLLFSIVTVYAESVTTMHYVFQDWVGKYTGQVDSNSIPFGFGVFISESPMNNELWHYIGMWEDGLPNGEGAIYSENGSMQKGTFNKGLLVEGLIYSVSGLSVVPIVIEENNSDEDTMYVGNKNTMRFHLPSCQSVIQMKEKNKVFFSSREEAIDRHYQPCGSCNP